MSASSSSSDAMGNPFWYLNHRLRYDLPHLENISHGILPGKCHIAVLDYDENWKLLFDDYRQIHVNAEHPPESLLANWTHVCPRKVILVEDICMAAAHFLITTFDLNPEMFVNHFSGASVSSRSAEGVQAYENHDPDDWYTRCFQRDFISIKWMRPYRLNRDLDSATISDRRVVDGEREKYFGYSCNSWRMHTHFQANGSTWSRNEGKSTGLRGDTALASEERVTIWRGHRYGSDYITVLVDSSLNDTCEELEPPKKKPSGRGRRYTRNRRRNVTAVPGRDGPHRLQRMNNNFSSNRSSEILARSNEGSVNHLGSVGGPRSSDAVLPVLDETQEQDHNYPQNPDGYTSIEEGNQAGLQSQRASSEGYPPLPESSNNSQSAPSNRHSITYEASVQTRSHSGSIGNASYIRSANVPEPEGPSGRNNGQAALVERDMGTKFPFFFKVRQLTTVRNVTRRAPCGNMTIKYAYYTNNIQPLTSTLEDLCMWMSTYSLQNFAVDQHFGPCIFMYNIVCQDIKDTMRLIHGYLDEITSLADDELTLERNILMWRQMLWYFGRELRILRSDLIKLTQFLYVKDGHGHTTNIHGFISSNVNGEMSKSIADIEARLQTTFTMLSSSISVAEARRGITEAESVTRLTELAFVYIPLSFAASFFGMQVKELNPETTSIGGFFGLAAGVTILSYSLRLIIRSERIVNHREAFVRAVRTKYGLQDGAPIKTRQAIGYAVQKVQASVPFALFLVLLPAPLLPMISVWINANLNQGIKLAVTLCYIVMGVFFAYYTFTYFVRPDLRIFRSSGRKRPSKRL